MYRKFRMASDKTNRFKIYCCYAFVTPLLMTILLAIIDNSGLKWLENYTPNFGIVYCAIEAGRRDMEFYMIPLSILNMFSALFIILATYHFFKRTRAGETSGYTRFDMEKDRFIMYLKLFGFMAVIWSCEIISYFISINEFIISDILHCLQGVVIFIIFVLHKSTRELILASASGNSVELPKENSNDSNSTDGNFQKF